MLNFSQGSKDSWSTAAKHLLNGLPWFTDDFSMENVVQVRLNVLSLICIFSQHAKLEWWSQKDGKPQCFHWLDFNAPKWMWKQQLELLLLKLFNCRWFHLSNMTLMRKTLWTETEIGPKWNFPLCLTIIFLIKCGKFPFLCSVSENLSFTTIQSKILFKFQRQFCAFFG